MRTQRPHHTIYDYTPEAEVLRERRALQAASQSGALTAADLDKLGKIDGALKRIHEARMRLLVA
jgi:hypothetical protein